MRAFFVLAILTALAAATLLTACGSGSPSPTVATTSAAPAPAGGTVPSEATEEAAGMVPNFIGKGLQTARDDARAAGFHKLRSHDATGRARHQILDRDWKVCFQAPAAGTPAGADTTLDFGVVKLDETCPAHDKGTQPPSPTREGQGMPDFIGKSLNVATSSLPGSTSITSKDVSGRDRLIIVKSNWKVCTQDPRPGAQFYGQPVSLGVVKFGQACP
ncbi:MAG TPA: hypothetical protein VLW50_03805 [Streptosporangiaceae bacterium]|nr:hypothetical protein [Streptosporangiaceae bacterium]